MQHLFAIAIASILAVCSAVAEDRPIILVTPQGVWQADVVDGVPGQFKALNADVLIQGFGDGGNGGGGGGDSETPNPPTPADPIVSQVKSLAIEHLQTDQEATAVVALIDTIAGQVDFSSEHAVTQFVRGVTRGAGVADDFLRSDGRLERFVTAAFDVTTDPVKLSAGVSAAFGLDSANIRALKAAIDSGDPEDAPIPVRSGDPQKAIDFALIVTLITKVIELLQLFGILD